MVDVLQADANGIVAFLATAKDTAISGSVSETVVGLGVAGLADELTGGGDNNDRTDLVAVRQTRAGGLLAHSDADNAFDGRGGPTAADTDSVKVTKRDGDTVVYRWYGKVPGAADEVEGVIAVAVAHDNEGAITAAQFSTDAVVSAESIDIDGDRPLWLFNATNETNARVLNWAGLALENNGTDHDFTTDAENPTAGGHIDTFYTSTRKLVKGLNGVDLNTRYVLGIGDTLTYSLKIGTDILSEFVLGEEGGGSLRLEVEAFGKTSPVTIASRAIDVLKIQDIIGEGEYGDLDEKKLPWAAVSTDVTPRTDEADSLIFFIVDEAGNRSGATINDDEPSRAIFALTDLLFDSEKPVLSTSSAVDTIFPVTVDTISDGGLKDYSGGPVDDENPITYSLADALSALEVKFGSGDDAPKFTITNSDLEVGNGELRVSDSIEDTRTVDFTQLGDDPAPATDGDEPGHADTVRVSSGGEFYFGGPAANPLTKAIADGMYEIAFTGTDLAGNKGLALKRADVYVDVTDIDFVRSFPFGEKETSEDSGLDTIEAKTAVVVFRLSEPADSVLVNYHPISAGADADSVDADDNTYSLVGSQLTTTGIEQKFRVPGLQHDNQYELTVTGRDLAGNWVQDGPDTFWYNDDFVVPQAVKFAVEITTTGLDKVLAGDKIEVTLKAFPVEGDKPAPTYDSPATVTIGGGTGIALSGDGNTGATDNGDGTISLNGEDWIIGTRNIAFADTVSIENLTISIEADDDSTLVGEADSVVVVSPAGYSQIFVSVADDSVMQGENFMVNVVIADKFGNQRVEDNRFVAVSTNTIGVQVPPDAVHISKGAGSFMVNSSGWSGDLTLSVRDIAARDPLKPVETANTLGTGTVYVRASDDAPVVDPDPDPEEAPDAPDQLVAEDYAGASGEGDQGGFVLLTWDASDDHDSLDKYRVYRQIAVSTVMDEETGNFVTLPEPTTALVHWGTIDAIPGADVMRVVVATLDSDATAFGVAAERGGRSSKQAFGPGQNVENPYELMAQTMSRSREAAQPVSDAPVFATLSPEALTYQAKGVVPLLKSVDSDVLRSEITKSEVVRSIDNIPPGAIPYLKVLDTPGDAGGSIRVTWTTSPDDRMLTTTVGSAIGLGGHVYSVGGVAGYNVYRKIGDGAFELIGKAGSGETSFDDATVFNGVRYTYQVKPYDIDNETDSELEGTAMAIRNQVLDANGNVVLGLFGSDDKVGFDDFFILADQFGMTVEDEDFEPAFDLSPNNKIDLNDFFTFADFFGRTVEGAGKALPISMAGLNSDARFYLDAGTELPRVGEEMAILVSLEDFVELKGYGFSVSYDPQVLTYVGTRVENSILGAGEFAEGQLVSHKDGLVSLVTYGDVATEGDLGLSLLFRSLQEIEDSYIDIVNAEVRDGNYGLNTLATPVSVRIQTRPEVYALRNNFPNPFNPETTLKYDLPEAGDVKLEVYNMLGQVVRTLVNEHQTAGRYAVQWDATNGHGQSMSSGIYFYRVQVEGEFTDVKKMLLLK